MDLSTYESFTQPELIDQVANHGRWTGIFILALVGVAGYLFSKLGPASSDSPNSDKVKAPQLTGAIMSCMMLVGTLMWGGHHFVAKDGLAAWTSPDLYGQTMLAQAQKAKPDIPDGVEIDDPERATQLLNTISELRSELTHMTESRKQWSELARKFEEEVKVLTEELDEVTLTAMAKD